MLFLPCRKLGHAGSQISAMFLPSKLSRQARSQPLDPLPARLLCAHQSDSSHAAGAAASICALRRILTNRQRLAAATFQGLGQLNSTRKRRRVDEHDRGWPAGHCFQA